MLNANFKMINADFKVAYTFMQVSLQVSLQVSMHLMVYPRSTNINFLSFASGSLLFAQKLLPGVFTLLR